MIKRIKIIEKRELDPEKKGRKVSRRELFMKIMKELGFVDLGTDKNQKFLMFKKQ